MEDRCVRQDSPRDGSVAGASASGNPLRERILLAGGWVTAGFVLDKVIAAAQLAILARLLTPADFGLMAASAVVLVALLTLSEVGLEPALVARQDPGREDLAVAWTLSLGRALVLAVCVWLFADAIAAFFGTAALASLLRVHALALLIQGVQSPALALLLRNLDLGRRVRLDLVRRVIEAAVTIGLAFWLRNAWALLWGQLIGFTFGCALSYRIAPFSPHLSLARESLTHFLRYGKQFNLTTILIVGVTSGGEFVVGRMLGIDALGMYQIALAIPVLIGLRAGVAMSQVSFPAYALLQHDRAGTIRALTLHLCMIGLVFVFLATGVAVFAADLVRVLFGARWLDAAGPLPILCVYAACAGLSVAMSSLHYGLNRPDIQTRIWTVQFVSYAALIVPLTGWFGLVGAAASLALASAVGFWLHVVYTIRLIGPEGWTIFGALGRVTMPVLGIGGAMRFLLGQLTEPAWLLGVLGLAAGIVFAFYLWRREYPRLQELWRRPEADPLQDSPRLGDAPVEAVTRDPRAVLSRQERI